MSTASTPSPIRRDSPLAGQTVVVIGGSAGIGLETARLARAEGAKLILAARTPEPLQRAASELGALSSAAFDATDFERLAKFFDELPTPIHHVLVTGPGPYYAPLAEIDFEKARRHVETHLLLPTHVARNAIGKVRPGGCRSPKFCPSVISTGYRDKGPTVYICIYKGSTSWCNARGGTR